MIAKKHKLFIGGKWIESTSGETFNDLNPFTGEVYAQVPAGTREDARQAIDAAKAAFPGWASSSPASRRQIFLAAADILERRQEELV